MVNPSGFRPLRPFALLQAFFGIACLLVLDGGQVFLFYTALCAVSWAWLFYASRRRRPLLAEYPSLRYLLPVFCAILAFAFSALWIELTAH